MIPRRDMPVDASVVPILWAGLTAFYRRDRGRLAWQHARVAAPVRFPTPLAAYIPFIDDTPLAWADRPDALRRASEACERARRIVAKCQADRTRRTIVRARSLVLLTDARDRQRRT